MTHTCVVTMSGMMHTCDMTHTYDKTMCVIVTQRLLSLWCVIC